MAACVVLMFASPAPHRLEFAVLMLGIVAAGLIGAFALVDAELLAVEAPRPNTHDPNLSKDARTRNPLRT